MGELTVHYKYELFYAPAWYKKLWAKHQKRLRGLPNWKLALAFKDGKFCKGTSGSPKSSRSSSSSSSGRSSRSVSDSECISSDIILEEPEAEEEDMEEAANVSCDVST